MCYNTGVIVLMYIFRIGRGYLFRYLPIINKYGWQQSIWSVAFNFKVQTFRASRAILSSLSTVLETL